jgi:hypothetical protein
MDELSEIRWLIERTKIIEIIVRFANAMDEKDWQRLPTCLADEMIKANGQWRINAIQQTVVIISGNPEVHGALRGTS